MERVSGYGNLGRVSRPIGQRDQRHGNHCACGFEQCRPIEPKPYRRPPAGKKCLARSKSRDADNTKFTNPMAARTPSETATGL